MLAVGGAYAIASFNWCGPRPAQAPVVTRQSGEGALHGGAARVAIDVPFPVVVAGFGPMRPEATRSALPLHARAVVLEQGPLRVGLVSLELLLIPRSLTEAIEARAAALGLDALLVTATHSHSSFGGYDDRLIFQLAGTGAARSDVSGAVVSAAASALEQAVAALEPVVLSHATGAAEGLVISRAADMPADAALTRVRFSGARGPTAELVIVSAHPTFRSGDVLSPDYPGWLSADGEENGGPITLVLMGAVGNGQAAGPAADAYGHALAEAMRKLEPSPASGPLAFASARLALPSPDSSRLVPGIVRRAGDNFLCASSPRDARLSLLELGGLRLLFTPGEVTQEAAAPLREAAAAQRVISLAGDYLGYFEAPARVRQRSGESKRQYFVPELHDRLVSAAAALAPR